MRGKSIKNFAIENIENKYNVTNFFFHVSLDSSSNILWIQNDFFSILSIFVNSEIYNVENLPRLIFRIVSNAYEKLTALNIKNGKRRRLLNDLNHKKPGGKSGFFNSQLLKPVFENLYLRNYLW